MDYQEAVKYLDSYTDYEKIPSVAYREGNYNPRRLEILMEKRGSPHLGPRTVHVAGTKGKGSTAAMIASVLSASGRRTALYTSPHLLTVRERVRVDGELIGEGELADIVSDLHPDIEWVNLESGLGRLTTFEILTALAFVHFQRKGVEFQVLEVGLGGRLDATNIVRPDVCVITSISLDHTDVLGDRLTDIAREKSGIIKPGCTVVVAPQVEEVLKVIEAAISVAGASAVEVGRDLTWKGMGVRRGRQSLEVVGQKGTYTFSVPLLGDFQLENAALAVAALECLMRRGVKIDPGDLRRGMEGVSWPGRVQVLGRRPTVVVDGAHNAYSVRRLTQALKRHFRYPQAVLVVGMSVDKDLEGMVAELSGFFKRVIVTRSRHPRAAATMRLAQLFSARGVTVEQREGVAEALAYAISSAGTRDLVCATGSLFVVAEALEYWARRGAEGR